MDDALSRFLALYSSPIQDLILRTRALIQEVIPTAVEQVDIPSRIIAYGYGVRYKDLICAISPYSSHVNLMFSQGAALPDPDGLLEGTGKHARHIKLMAAEQLGNPGVRKMIETARDAISPLPGASRVDA